MSTLKFCKNCKKCSEIKTNIKFEFGTEYIEYICSNCGYIERTTKNHIHYGNDGIKK